MPGNNNFDSIIRSVLNSTQKTSTTGPYGPNVIIDGTDKFDPLEFPGRIPPFMPPPKYPEINPSYPGPFLRDPGELDPWEERYRV